MPAVTLTRGFFAYKSDDGDTYQLATTLQNGSAQSATPVSAGTNPAYPRGYKPRIAYGVASGGARTRLPILDPANGIWTESTLTFTKDSTTYTVEGLRGEQRYTKGG